MSFPIGISQPIAASNCVPGSFFEAGNVYKVAGTSQYLLAASQAKPFVVGNVSFGGGSAITISHRNLQYLYRGDAPARIPSYNAIPWRIKHGHRPIPPASRHPAARPYQPTK